jgi:hypothetical protein
VSPAATVRPVREGYPLHDLRRVYRFGQHHRQVRCLVPAEGAGRRAGARRYLSVRLAANERLVDRVAVRVCANRAASSHRRYGTLPEGTEVSTAVP